MSERSKTISKLKSSFEARCAYVSAKLSILVPSQIRALRLKSNMPRQSELAKEANMKQSRISMLETPGAANVTLETLSRIAAAFHVGVVVKFVPFSEMLEWENSYSQDRFDVVRLENDDAFLSPPTATPALSIWSQPRNSFGWFSGSSGFTYVPWRNPSAAEIGNIQIGVSGLEMRGTEVLSRGVFTYIEPVPPVNQSIQ